MRLSRFPDEPIVAILRTKAVAAVAKHRASSEQTIAQLAAENTHGEALYDRSDLHRKLVSVPTATGPSANRIGSYCAYCSPSGKRCGR